MQKKFFWLSLLLLFITTLVACGDSETSDETTADATENESAEQASNEGEESDPEEESTSDENVKESEVGKMTIAYKNKGLNEHAVSGPMTLDIKGLQIGELEVAENYQDMFEGKNKLTVIAFQLKAENSSDDTIGFYPDQATITTDAGDQVDADLFMSDQVGGDFIGKVKKEGEVFFFIDTPASDIGEVKFIVDGAHDEEFEGIGEQIERSFTIE